MQNSNQPLVDDETKNLISVGMFRSIDTFFVLVIFGLLATLLGCALAGTAPYKLLILVGVLTIFWLAWLTILVFRTCNFVIQTLATAKVVAEKAEAIGQTPQAQPEATKPESTLTS
jgi:uncharacterized Tic20 family protein